VGNYENIPLSRDLLVSSKFHITSSRATIWSHNYHNFDLEHHQNQLYQTLLLRLR
jgi:hypothetical protein